MLIAQEISTHKLTFSAYGEMYYGYDFSNPPNHLRPDFVYNFKRHNEISANLLLVQGDYQDQNVRGSLAFMTGNYAQYTLAAEPTWAQFVYQANIGVKLSKTKNVWVDVGIFPSHLGFESALGADGYTLTRSLVAENSPYYEAGVRLSSTSASGKIYLGFFALNGWQTIAKPDAFQIPAFGGQVNYKAGAHWVLNYSNYFGARQTDTIKALRTFHNLYAQYTSGRHWDAILGFDIGTDKYNPTHYGLWYAPVVILRYAFNQRWAIAWRGEYYNDKHQIIVPTYTPNGFQVSGVSCNIDYKINPKAMIRLEGKWYNAKDKIFRINTTDNYCLTSSLSLKL